MAYKFTQDQLVFHALWKRAAKDGMFVVTCTNLADARKMRFGMYNSVKPLRDGKASLPDVVDAADECSISIQELPDGTAELVIQHRVSTTMLQSALGALGQSLEQVLGESPAEVMDSEVAESLHRLSEKLAEVPEDKVRTTPYYTREG